MRILLIDGDMDRHRMKLERTGQKKVWPNTALMQIAGYYKDQGHEVGWDVPDPDMIYISAIFKNNREKALSAAQLYRQAYPGAVVDVGGSGVDIHKRLPDEIFYSRPDYSLYPKLRYSIGSTTWGCIRRCHFCIAWQKEKGYSVTKHPELFYDPRFRQIYFQDNNILADKEWFKYVCGWVRDHKLWCDFNQGLDARLLDHDVAEELAETKVIDRWHMAYDDERYEKSVRRAIRHMQDFGINTKRRLTVYVYCDGDHDVPSAVKRCRQVKEWGASAFAMLNIDVEASDKMQRLKDWTNPKVFSIADYKDVDRRARA